MATRTSTQRQAAAKRAAATRKRNATKRSASATKAAARRTRSSVSATTQDARRTTRQATRTAGRGLDAAATRLGVIGRHAQRALLVQVGAAATLGDNLRRTARTYTDLELVTRELRRLERRGERALSRGRRGLGRDARHTRRAVERQWDEVRSDAEAVINQIRRVA